MKKVIKGLLYDTEKSTLIYEDPNHRQYYKTTNGRFFVAYTTGEIAVKSEESMRDILGTFDYGAYVSVFGEPEEA